MRHIITLTLLLSFGQPLWAESTSSENKDKGRDLQLEISQKSTLSVYRTIKLLKQKGQAEYQEYRQQKKLKARPSKSI